MFDRLLEAKAPVDDALFETLLTSGRIVLADAVLQRLPSRSAAEWKARKKQARQEGASGEVRRYLRERVRDARARRRERPPTSG